MQQPQPEPVTLNDILITEELSNRSPRPPNLLSENQALHTLARQLVNQPETMLQSLVDISLDLCNVGTAGVSLLETTPNGEEVFRWKVLAGALAQYVGGTTPRNFSPCAVCLERGTPVLFSHPDRYFTYFQAANTPIVEGLVLPLIADNHALGTIWIMSHDEQRHFDSEDVRVMTSLADFTAAALLLNQRQTQELLAKNTQLEAEAVDRQQAEAAIAADLQDTQLLHNLAARLTTEGDIETLYQEIMAAAIALTHAVAGSIQILDEATQELVLIAIQGSTPEMAQRFHRIDARSHTSCGRALVTGDRTFVDFDVPQSEDPDGSMRMHVEAGFLSAQSTPLITRSGRAIGMVSTHWGTHHRPTERELRFLDLLARQAADLIEQRLAEAALRENEEKFRTLADTAPALIWYNDAQGENRFINQHFLDFTGKSVEQIRGEGWHELVHPDDAEDYIADYLAAVREQRPWSNRNRIRRHDGVWRWHDNYARPLFSDNGVYLGHVGVTIDNTDAIEAEIALRESEAKYRSLFNSIDEGFCIIELIDDKAGRTVDCRFLEVNPIFERLTGVQNVIGKTDKELNINTEPHWLDNYDRVARTGEPLRLENYHAATEHWYQAYVSRVGGEGSRQIAIVFDDITDRKQSERELTRTNQLLQATFDNSLQVIQLFKAVRDECGDIIDFEWLLTNKQWNDQWGKMAGKRLLSENPAVVETGLFDLFKQVTESGVPVMHEHYYAHEQFNGWFLQTIAQVEDGFLLSTLDTTERKLAEEALRESEERYRSLFNSIDEGFHIIELIDNEAGEVVDYRFLESNPAFEQLTGLKNTAGKLGSEIAPQTESDWIEVYDRVARTGEPLRIENYNEDTKRWYSAAASRVNGAGSRRVAIIFDDITDRKRAEERQVFLLKLNDILQRFVQPNDIKTAAMRLLGEHLGVSRAQYHECDSSGEYYSADGVGYANGLPLLDLKYRIDDFGTFVNEDFAAGRPYRSDDLEVDPRVSAEEREAYRTYQIRAGAGVPLIRGGKLVAILAIHDVHPHPWTDLEMDLIRETAERIWTPLERARAEAALRESEVKYRSLFTSIDEGFNLLEMISDESGHPADFRILETNPAWEQQTGLTDATGKTLLEITPNFEQQLLDFYSDVVISGRGRRTEYYTAAVDRWFTVYASRIGGEGSRQVAVVFNDISDRKRTEQQQAFLLKFSDALRAEPDADSVANRAVRMLAEHLHLDRFWLSEVFEQQDISTVGPEYRRPDLPPMSGVFRLSDYPETMWQLATQPMVIHDAANDPRFSDSEKALLAQLHLRALLVVSLREGQHQVIWALAAAMTTPRHWNESERVLLEKVGERAWAAIERARAEATLRELELQRVREQSAREQEQQRAESLAKLDRAKTLFFTHVSHEFRTPLTLLLAPLQDALSDVTHPLDPVHRERLELAQRNATRLLKLVNTLLDFSRIEAGRMEAVYEPTDLALFTTELASVFRSAIERAGLQLLVDCPPLPEPVYVDREMWEKIVLNLLSNAFKFTLEGEIAVILHPAENHQVMLEIQDTGTGIAPEHLPHLFERFYQIRGVQARTHEGSGIGLALVHELIQLHGGAIAVSSTVGQGTCFTITLPLGTDHLRSDRLQLDVGDRITATRTLASTAIDATAYVEEAQRWLPADSDPPQPPLKRGENSLKVPLFKGDLGGSSGLRTESTKSAPHILLVDDNADMREYLTRILSEHVHVEAFADGASALAAVQERVPDLVLTDVMMPGLDGFELLRALRANPRTREVPIILLSARAGEEAVIEGLQAGADDYLIKPFSAQELVSRVNGHLQMAQLRLEALYQERTLNRRKDELLSTVSHELNTPLVAILGWTRLLRANPPNQSILMKALETIERNATLQAKLVQDLLDMSRITAGKLRLKLEPVELESVVETAIATVSPTAQAKGLNLMWQGITTQFSNSRQEQNLDSVVVMGDRDRLQQIIYNLLTNAIKFTPELGNINVGLSVVEGKNSSDALIAVISITDTGIGISAEFLPHVFDRFRQAEHSSSSKGLGLGLAIARHLVELHNGTIRAESAGVGQGATFVVRLPLMQ